MMPNRITHFKSSISLIFAMSFVCLSAWFGQGNVSFSQTSIELISHLDNNSANLDSDDKQIYLRENTSFNLPCCGLCCRYTHSFQFEIPPNPYLIALQRAPPQRSI